jgi:hypothetical protein
MKAPQRLSFYSRLTACQAHFKYSHEADKGRIELLALNNPGFSSFPQTSSIVPVQDTWLVAPVKGNAQSFAGLAALARSLQQEEAGLLARFYPRMDSEVSIGFLTPHFISMEGPSPDFAGLLMNILPFEDDIRWARFASWQEKPDLKPEKREVAAMGQLIDAFTIDDGGYFFQL